MSQEIIKPNDQVIKPLLIYSRWLKHGDHKKVEQCNTEIYETITGHVITSGECTIDVREYGIILGATGWQIVKPGDYIIQNINPGGTIYSVITQEIFNQILIDGNLALKIVPSEEERIKGFLEVKILDRINQLVFTDMQNIKKRIFSYGKELENVYHQIAIQYGKDVRCDAYPPSKLIEHSGGTTKEITEFKDIETIAIAVFGKAGLEDIYRKLIAGYDFQPQNITASELLNNALAIYGYPTTNRNQQAINLLESFSTEGDAQEQRETWEHIEKNLEN